LYLSVKQITISIIKIKMRQLIHTHQSGTGSPLIKSLLWILFFCLTQETTSFGQILYATGEIPPDPFGSLIKIDLATCTFCRVSFMVDNSDLDLTLLPNGNVVNSSGNIKVYDPPNQDPIFILDIAPQVAVGNILNPAGNVYIATQQGLGVFNPVTNQFTYIGIWPSAFLPVVEMELWYEGGQLYGYFGFPVQQVAQIDVNNPGNSVITGAINYAGFIQGATNVSGADYMINTNTVYSFDLSTGDLNTLCDFSNTTLQMKGLSNVPGGFPNFPCLCTTNAGTIANQGLTNYCVNESIVFTHNGNQILDNNDILQFVLFSNPNDTLGSIIATSNTPNFTFAPPMQTGVTYYVAAMAGNNLNGNVDLSDPCLDFSNANAVVWRPRPAVVFTVPNASLCAGDCKTITATFTGTPPFALTYTTPAGTFSQTFSGNTGTIQVCAPAGSAPGGFQIIATALTDAWCTCQ
jgi:hypothetical protein